MTIGIVGTGRMGSAFARRLIDTKHSVMVWNRTVENTKPCISAGAILAANIADLAQCDAIIISLTDAVAVNSAVDEIITSGIKEKLIIDMSTLLPSESIDVSSKVKEAGSEFVECPVGGTVAPALNGQLLGLVGSTEASFLKAKPLLKTLCKRVEYLGEVGSGSHMKLALNLPLIIYWQTLGESLALLEGSNIPMEQAISLIADSSAGPSLLKQRSQLVIDSMNGLDRDGTFDIAGLSKDLQLALTLGKSKGKSQPLSQVSALSYQRALETKLGHLDGASLTRRVAKTTNSL